MIEIYCDDHRQKQWLQEVIANSDMCPFDNTKIRCEPGFDCILCVREHIDWNIKEK